MAKQKKPDSRNPGKVVLAYSGGLDTSVILKWLQDTYGCEVMTFTADIGQGEELGPARRKAKMMGVRSIFVEDLREEFVRDFVFPMFRANAVYEGEYLLGTSIARPLIAKRLVEIARKTGADAISHGATGKGNDQVRFDVTFQTLAPDLKIIAPVREWKMSRDQALEYAAKHNIPVEATVKSPYSLDMNLFGRSCEAGVLEDPWTEPPEEAFGWTTSPERAPDTADYVTIDFETGRPVGLDGKAMDGVPLIEALNAVGGKHGVGRIDMVESRFVGMKSRGVYETPGGTITVVPLSE